MNMELDRRREPDFRGAPEGPGQRRRSIEGRVFLQKLPIVGRLDPENAGGEEGEHPQFRRRGAGWLGYRDGVQHVQHHFLQPGSRRNNDSSGPAFMPDPVPL